jgi:hypothetical protein
MRPSLSLSCRVLRLAIAATCSWLVCACSTGETVSPVSRVPPDAGSAYTGPSTLTVGTSQARVVLRLETFGMTIENAAGTALLESFDGPSTVAGDTANAYGALGGTYHDVILALPGASYGWDHERGTDYPWRHATKVLRASSTATSASVDLFDPADPSTTFHLDVNVDGADVVVDAHVSALGAIDQGDPSAGIGPLNQMGQSFVLPADEHFFGLGEKKGTVDHRGQHYESWCEEGGIGQGEGVAPGQSNPSPNGINMTNLPVPFYLSSRGYGVYMETTYRTGYSFGADDPGLYRIYAAEPHLRYHVFVHQDPKDTIADYTLLTGRARLPAPWVFGPRRRVDDTAMVNGVPEYVALRNAQVPTTMVDDATHFLPIGSEVGRESTLEQRNLALHALGFKSVAYYNAFVSTEDPRAADLYASGTAHDLFVKLNDGTEFDCPVVSAGQQEVATIDLTNPEAATWYGTILAPRTAAGVVSADDVAGIYDVRAAIDESTGSGSQELADGTMFATSLGAGAVSLPANVATAASAADLATCAACGLIESVTGGATRVRVSVAGVGAAVLQAGALALRHDSVEPLRVRWDVIVVP